MRRILSLLAIASLTACGGGGGSVVPFTVTVAGTMTVAPALVCTVEINGDSIARFDTNEVRLVTLLKQARPKYTITDKAVSGQLATQRAAVFNNEQHASRIVVLEHGMNDMLVGTSASLATSMRSMANYAKSSGAKVIITGISKVDVAAYPKYPEFRDTVAFVSNEVGAVYADWPSVVGTTNDGIHPGLTMTPALLTKLTDAMDSIAPECK